MQTFYDWLRQQQQVGVVLPRTVETARAIASFLTQSWITGRQAIIVSDKHEQIEAAFGVKLSSQLFLTSDEINPENPQSIRKIACDFILIDGPEMFTTKLLANIPPKAYRIIFIPYQISRNFSDNSFLSTLDKAYLTLEWEGPRICYQVSQVENQVQKMVNLLCNLITHPNLKHLIITNQIEGYLNTLPGYLGERLQNIELDEPNQTNATTSDTLNSTNRESGSGSGLIPSAIPSPRAAPSQVAVDSPINSKINLKLIQPTELARLDNQIGIGMIHITDPVESPEIFLDWISQAVYKLRNYLETPIEQLVLIWYLENNNEEETKSYQNIAQWVQFDQSRYLDLVNQSRTLGYRNGEMVVNNLSN